MIKEQTTGGGVAIQQTREKEKVILLQATEREIF